MFDATASKYSKIQFEKIDIDKGDPRVAKYGISSIPHAVFLDSGNTVLYNGSVWGSPDDFGAMVK